MNDCGRVKLGQMKGKVADKNWGLDE